MSILCLLTSGATWIMGAARALAVSCYDGAGARVLGVTISTTLISYLLSYPALWKLRRSHPATLRPYRMPAYRPLTVILMALVAVASVQLIAPGLGSSWFGSDVRSEDWIFAERYTYLWTKLVPVLAFIAIGVLFWWLGRRTRAQAVDVAAEPAAPSG